MITTFTTRKHAGDGRVRELTPAERERYAGCMSGDRAENLARIEAKVGTDDEDVFVHTFEGAVLAEWERNMHDDSDFYASAWDGEKIVSICWGTTRGWTFWNGCSVDASDEVREAAGVWLNARRRALQVEQLNAAAKVPTVNARVRVVGGRPKVKGGDPIDMGTEGTVFWFGDDRFSGSRWTSPTKRVGIRTADGRKFFTPARNVEVIDPETFTLDDTQDTPVERLNFARIGEQFAAQALQTVATEREAS